MQKMIVGQRLDTTKTVNGVWHNMGGQVVKVAKYGNPESKAYLGRLLDEYEQEHGEKPAGDDLNIIYFTVFAETILLDWKNVEDTDGNPVEYSPAILIDQIKDDPESFFELYGEWWREIDQFARNAQNFVSTKAKRTAKKSSRRKSGSVASARKRSNT